MGWKGEDQSFDGFGFGVIKGERNDGSDVSSMGDVFASNDIDFWDISSMDNVFASDDIDFWDLDRSSNFRSQCPCLLNYDNDEENNDNNGDLFDPQLDSQKVYLVPNV